MLHFSVSSCSSFLKGLEGLKATLQQQNIPRQCQCDNFIGFQHETWRPPEHTEEAQPYFFHKPYHVLEGHHCWYFWHRRVFGSLLWCFGMLPQQIKRLLQHRELPVYRKNNDETWQLNEQCLCVGKYRITTIITALSFSYSPNTVWLCVFCLFLLPLCCLLSLVPSFHVLCVAHNMVSSSCSLLQQRKKT